MYESMLLIAICSSFLAAGCAVVCWRQASALTSQRTRLRQALESVESSELRIDELHKRVNSISRKYALEERRDPETGKSRAVREELPQDPYERKAALRRQYGLNGLNHADIARRASRAGE